MRILRLITSIKTAVVLLILIAVFAIPSTFIPQNKSAEEYVSMYGKEGTRVLITFMMHRYFRSPLFLVPVAGFFINLSACTVKRILKQFDGRRRNFAPDVLHLGLLILIFAAVLTAVTRRSETIILSAGEAVRLDNGYTIALKDFEIHYYPDGRTKDYISYLQVSLPERLLHESYPLEVNHPLRLGSLRIYQSSYYREIVLDLHDPKGVVHRMVSGSPVRIGEESYVIKGFEERKDGRMSALIAEQESGRKFRLSQGDVFFGLKVTSVEPKKYTGLNVVRDTGYLILIMGFIIAMSGLAAHYVVRIIHRRKYK